MPHDDDRTRLFHMWEAASEALAFTNTRTRDDLDHDKLFQYAVIHLLEIIGEAAGKVGPEIRSANPDIPWGSIVGMRNRLTHGYFDINLNLVWFTLTESLPQLLPALTRILREEGVIE